MFVLSPFVSLKVFSATIQHSSKVYGTEASIERRERFLVSPEMTRVFNYFTASRDRGGCVETTERPREVGVHGVEVIYIFSQYSSHSSAVSSVERTPSPIPLFSDPLSTPLSSLVHPLRTNTDFATFLVGVSVPVAGFDGSTILIERRKLKRFNLKSLCRFVLFD